MHTSSPDPPLLSRISELFHIQFATVTAVNIACYAAAHRSLEHGAVLKLHGSSKVCHWSCRPRRLLAGILPYIRAVICQISTEGSESQGAEFITRIVLVGICAVPLTPEVGYHDRQSPAQ